MARFETIGLGSLKVATNFNAHALLKLKSIDC